VARGLLAVVVGEGVADRLGTALTAVPVVVDYPIAHLAWPGLASTRPTPHAPNWSGWPSG
jgi:hypothetical protein